MKALTLFDFVNKLRAEGIAFELINPNESLKVIPANFKNVIRNGFYHITSGYNGDMSSIESSIVLSDIEVQLGDTNTVILVRDPQLIHYLLCQLYVEDKKAEIHPTVIINERAQIGNNVNIGAFSVIGECILEDNVWIESNVVIHDNAVIKHETFIDSHCSIGPAGIAWVWNEKGERVKQPQFGGVVIEENCHICTDVTIVRGSMSENTTIGRGTVIAHGSKIGHGSKVGRYVHMANNVSIAGNTTLGNRSFYGSGAIVPPNISIPDNCIVGAGAVVNKTFHGEYLTLVGVPAKVLRNNSHEVKAKGAPIPYKNS